MSAGVLAPPQDLEVAGVVLHAERHVVARLQARRPEQAAQPVGRVVELGVGLRPPGVGHDDRGLVGVRGEMSTGIHGRAR